MRDSNELFMAELEKMRADLFSMAEALQPHTQEMYDEAVFTSHLNMIDPHCKQCVKSINLAHLFHDRLAEYLKNWQPKRKEA